MANDSIRQTPRDRGRINLEEPRELHYWTQALSVTEAELRSAVSVAGDATPAVQQYLSGQVPDRGEVLVGYVPSPATPRQPRQPQQQQQQH